MLYKQAMEKADSIDPDAVRAVWDDPTWEYEWFGMTGRKMGGLETDGILRQNQEENVFSIVTDGKRVQLSREVSVVP